MECNSCWGTVITDIIFVLPRHLQSVLYLFYFRKTANCCSEMKDFRCLRRSGIHQMPIWLLRTASSVIKDLCCAVMQSWWLQYLTVGGWSWETVCRTSGTGSTGGRGGLSTCSSQVTGINTLGLNTPTHDRVQKKTDVRVQKGQKCFQHLMDVKNADNFVSFHNVDEMCRWSQQLSNEVKPAVFVLFEPKYLIPPSV